MARSSPLLPTAGIVFVLGAVALGAALTLLPAAPVRADAGLARARNCVACHTMGRKLIGPSYRDIAVRYAGDKAAVARLARKVREGGTGVWGSIPMPANPQVTDAEAVTLVNWILGQR